MAGDSGEDEDARLAIPMGVTGETGEIPPELTTDALRNVRPESAAVLARAQRPRGLAATAERIDASDLTQTGWGVLFASDADPKIKDHLQPLLDWRKQQVQDDTLFRVFEGREGVGPGQKVGPWAAARGVTLSAPVKPVNGVPFYLLIVGSPTRIPFEFQQQLDLQWAVGRLHFDNIDDYATYAEKVIAYEKGALAAARRKQIALWMPRNVRDLATPMLAGTLGTDFLGQTPAPRTSPKLGAGQGFKLQPFIGDGQATKARLDDLFRGTVEGGPPAILFTGSHGAEWSMADPDRQRRLQGALVTQEWVRGQKLDETQHFSAADLATDAQVHGLIMFMFACFGGACPASDSYYFNQDGTRKALAPEALMTRLPQALLARGALAIIAHIDRAFSYGFQDTQGTPQAQLLRDPLERLMNGERVGLALDPLNAAWSSLAAQLGLELAAGPAGTAAAAAGLVNLTIARDDARNYMVIGDPAVRLDIGRLQ
jgi:hypothetical protein